MCGVVLKDKDLGLLKSSIALYFFPAFTNLFAIRRNINSFDKF